MMSFKKYSMSWMLAFTVMMPITGTTEERVTPEPAPKTIKKVVVQENQSIEFEGLSLEGELKTPGEFYFQNRNQERFDTLTKRRLNFHREILRDSIQTQ